jgi:hypothetical protein
MGMQAATEQVVFIRFYRYCLYLGKATSLSNISVCMPAYTKMKKRIFQRCNMCGSYSKSYYHWLLI